MKRLLIALTFTACIAMTTTTAADSKPDSKLYEMRVYYAEPGKFDALNARFRDYTLKLFEKHGISNLGYFVPADNKESKLVYFVSYPSKEAREKSFKDFLADPEWRKAFADSEKNGKLVTKIESKFMKATDYSPAIKADATGKRTFELRTYTATKGNLPGLDARFRDHTIGLFKKYGMTNIAYWHLAPDQEKADSMLIYLLAHKSQDAAKASFDAFRKDPEWLAAREASEKKAGGSLTETEKGVVSEMLIPTDYSPLK